VIAPFRCWLLHMAVDQLNCRLNTLSKFYVRTLMKEIQDLACSRNRSNTTKPLQHAVVSIISQCICLLFHNHELCTPDWALDDAKWNIRLCVGIPKCSKWSTTRKWIYSTMQTVIKQSAGNYHYICHKTWPRS